MTKTLLSRSAQSAIINHSDLLTSFQQQKQVFQIIILLGTCISQDRQGNATATNDPDIPVAYNKKGFSLTHVLCPWVS